MRGLKLFSRTNDRRLWNLASYHDPDSITWSWILSFRWRDKAERWHWFFFHSHRGNQGLRWDLCVLGRRMMWQTQNKMPRRRTPPFISQQLQKGE